MSKNDVLNSMDLDESILDNIQDPISRILTPENAIKGGSLGEFFGNGIKYIKVTWGTWKPHIVAAGTQIGAGVLLVGMVTVEGAIIYDIYEINTKGFGNDWISIGMNNAQQGLFNLLDKWTGRK
jgi:hypothetical protein